MAKIELLKEIKMVQVISQSQFDELKNRGLEKRLSQLGQIKSKVHEYRSFSLGEMFERHKTARAEALTELTVIAEQKRADYLKMRFVENNGMVSGMVRAVGSLYKIK